MRRQLTQRCVGDPEAHGVPSLTLERASIFKELEEGLCEWNVWLITNQGSQMVGERNWRRGDKHS
jgi:hypothetical protein